MIIIFFTKLAYGSWLNPKQTILCSAINCKFLFFLQTFDNYSCNLACYYVGRPMICYWKLKHLQIITDPFPSKINVYKIDCVSLHWSFFISLTNYNRNLPYKPYIHKQRGFVWIKWRDADICTSLHNMYMMYAKIVEGGVSNLWFIFYTLISSE